MMIALAVLAFALATLVGTQASTVRMLALADQMNVAAMLVRTRMQELEQELEEEGFEVGIETDHGDFEDDGYEDYEWLVEIEPVEITADAEDQFVANIHAELFGEGTTGEGSLSGSAAVSQYLPLIIGQVPQFINQVGERTRKITLTVSWDSLLGPQTLTVTQYYTTLEEQQQVVAIDGLGSVGGGGN
jgi:hypothetical protein